MGGAAMQVQYIIWNTIMDMHLLDDKQGFY